jgi:hypothetical protein
VLGAALLFATPGVELSPGLATEPVRLDPADPAACRGGARGRAVVQPAQLRAEAAPARFRKEGDDALREGSLPVPRQFAAHRQRPESPAREHGRGVRIIEQAAIAGTEVRLCQEVERALQISAQRYAALPAGRTRASPV